MVQTTIQTYNLTVFKSGDLVNNNLTLTMRITTKSFAIVILNTDILLYYCYCYPALFLRELVAKADADWLSIRKFK